MTAQIHRHTRTCLDTPAPKGPSRLQYVTIYKAAPLCRFVQDYNVITMFPLIYLLA